MTRYKTFKTGGDPRTLPDYAALCDEISRLTHPARPEVNWLYVETRCLSLFEQNGVELQTGAWYTLARMQRAGLFGLNEGLAILEALISQQWGVLWPHPVHARVEILSGLSQRLQQQIRLLPLNDGELSQWYRAEQLLTGLEAVLQRLELRHLSQLDTLRTLIHSRAVRLENSNDTAGTGPNMLSGIVLPASVMNGARTSAGALTAPPPEENSAPDSAVKWVYVAPSGHQANVEVLATVPTPVKKWKSFAAGMCTMLVISAAAVWGWQYIYRPDPLQTQFAVSLAPLPTMLTPAQLDVLRQQTALPKRFIAQAQQQLALLDKLPPDWNITYGRKLAEQAQTLWPEETLALIQQRQQQIRASALSADAMNGWHEGMRKLQALTTQLHALDGQKGKYITVSELKSQLFAAIQAFSQTVPVEEQLRQMSMRESPEMIPATQKSQTEQHLKQLIANYSAVTAGQ
ncbi:VasL domain-containing protein [Edwardsiella anguillarum]|uniref:VasL domain-containing protein n=1 Tax=Edwardsiella anguillarum TaxID=1821960 RepID=UPI0024B831F5|nr:VasL domain-containing protein [Edwardsiella anguillarum]WHQ15504.1 type VI secretion system ImpA family N-terminal domain-containing protein [Edwardsiella anguillarum]